MTQTQPNMTFPENSIMLSEWGGNILTAFSNDKIFPKDCDTHKFIIRNHYPYLCESIY